MKVEYYTCDQCGERIVRRGYSVNVIPIDYDDLYHETLQSYGAHVCSLTCGSRYLAASAVVERVAGT